MTTNEFRKENWQGMNWCRQNTRLAIYLRDGLACAYCGDSVENGVKLTLDHIQPHDLGGTNATCNLVTCCHRCNSSRGKRSVRAFASAVSEYLNHDVKASEIIKHINACASRDLKPYREQARQMIALRGSAAKVLANMAND